MEEFLVKAQEYLKTMSDIFSKTLEQEVDQMRNFEEKATTLISSTVNDVQDEISKLSRQSEEMKNCLLKKEPEFQEIRTRLKNKLVECYKKHYDPLDTLRAERAKIHKTASQLKLVAQRIVEKCMKANEPLQCFQRSLADLAKNAEELTKKFETHVKKEAKIMSKNIKLARVCNERAITEARQKYSRLIQDAKKCAK